MPQANLFLMGFLTLFLELAFIRYLPANIWNLGYFPNLVLLAVFFGMGIGFIFHTHLSEEKSKRVFRFVPLCLLIYVVALVALRPEVPGFTGGQGDVGGELYFTSYGDYDGIKTWAMFAVWFLSIVSLFSMISQYTAKLFSKFKPLHAYTLDISGSCVGILSFMLISWLQLPAWFWFLATLPVFLFVLSLPTRQAKLRLSATILSLVFLVGIEDSAIFQKLRGIDPIAQFVWSPYQKIKLRGPSISVNGIIHQNMGNKEGIQGSFYQSTYTARQKNPALRPYKRVLIIGAGSGNDVATALLNGAESIDAVEIDPVIAQFGKLYHPMQPYSDPRAHLFIDDGRSFMTKARHGQKYDLIVFALTDSLVKVSAMAQLRLENYLFTKESVERAYSLLNDQGSLIFYNFYRTPWLIEKLQNLLQAGSGQVPKVLFTQGDFVVMGVDKLQSSVAVSELNTSLGLPVDNWPFLYLKNKGLPAVYGGAMVFILIFNVILFLALEYTAKVSKRKNRLSKVGSPLTKGAFAFMGAAFLLLESKSVIQFSLLFGTTWKNSSMVFLAILALVLVANWTALLFKKQSYIFILFAFLFASCLFSFFFPISELLYMDNQVLRFVFASLITFTPIFFANLIFSIVFRDVAVPEQVFGWNLIGSTLGGVLEYSSMALGYNNLTLIVGMFYFLTFVFLVLVQTQRQNDSSPSFLFSGTPTKS